MDEIAACYVGRQQEHDLLGDCSGLVDDPRDPCGVETEEMAVQEMDDERQSGEGDEDGVEDYGADVEFLGVLVRGEEGECEVQAGEGEGEEDCIEDWRHGSCGVCIVGALGALLRWIGREPPIRRNVDEL